MSETKDGERERLGQDREEVSGNAGSARRRPHATENASDEEVQERSTSLEEIPVLPANASGKDMVPTSDQAQPIDEESMYDRRPEESKDRPPSGRTD